MKPAYGRWAPFALSVLGAAVSSLGQANPVGGTVAAGAAKLVQTAPNRLDVVQTSDRAIVNWTSFSVGLGEHVNFQQPSFQSSTLNRVTGGDVSAILGQITANGRVFLVNPNGILFGRDAKIDVAALVASTANISDTNFMAGRYRFDEAGNPNATIVNRGRITVGEGGLAAFIAPGVENAGLIRARLGRVVLASGNAYTLDLYGDRLINLVLDESTLSGLRDAKGAPIRPFVSQAGEVNADGGSVLITAAAARDVVDNVISVSGIVRARSVEQRNGEIVLLGPDRGGVAVSGLLDASGVAPGQKGGTVSVLGDRVHLHGTGRVDVSGTDGGGTALIGGDYHGRAPVRSASETRVDADAAITADALSRGDGGKVIVWANGSTIYSGSITAKGGPGGGDGGFIEVSGKERLTFRGDASASAARGKPGTLLLDPKNLDIGSSGRTTLAGSSGDDGQPAVYAVGEDAGSDATVQASTVANLLNRGTSVSLAASDDLTVSARIDGRGGSSGAGLTLSAGNNVRLNNDILTADGNVTVDASSASIVMGAGSADSITAGRGTVISAGRGTIALRAGGDVTVQHLLSSTGVEVTSATGSVNLARGFGGNTSSRFEQGSLTVTAANTVDVNGTIYAGGPVKLSGGNVILRHSMFTNNQSIELGRAGGTVTLDPVGDETSTSVIKDARTAQEVREPPVQGGSYAVKNENNAAFVVEGATFIRSGTSSGSLSTPAVTVEAETRRVTVNSGSAGADISFAGDVVGPPGNDQATKGLFQRPQATRSEPNAPGQRVPNQRLSGHYVALDLAAGSGTVRFASGIGLNATGTPSIADNPDSNNQSTAGRTTIDLTLQSAAVLLYDATKIFVNSFQRPATTVLPGGEIRLIFRAPINVEAFKVNPASNTGELQSAGFPPIFPEPNLSQPFDVNAASVAFSLPLAPAVAGSGSALATGTASGSIVIDQAVSQSQRTIYDDANTDVLLVDSGQGVARSADLGRSSPVYGATRDVFGRATSVVRLDSGSKETYQDDPYFQRDVFGRPLSETEETEESK